MSSYHLRPISRPIFFHSRKPFLIRSALLACAIGAAAAGLLAYWHELQGATAALGA